MSNTVFSPRVVGERRPDYFSLETLLASPLFAGKRDEEFALAIYNHFTSTVDGTWHGWPANETEGQPVGWADVDDPVKLLNVYGWMICGRCADMLQGIYRAAGYPSRIRAITGHHICEVFYGGRWHVLDVDMWTWFRTPEGHIAGVDELARNSRALIVENPNRSDPCDLPDRTLDDYAAMYATMRRTPDTSPFWATRAHTMDFVLRPGETLIRSEGHEGRFLLPLSWKPSLEGKLRSEWTGLPRERFAPFRTIGNGRWIYAPDLTSRTRDVEIGAWSRDGLTQDAEGLAGPGRIVFRVQSPYPFCGIPDAEKPGFPAADGVWLALAGEGAVTVSITNPEGDFVPVVIREKGPFDVRPDVTQWLKARYEGMIRIDLAAGARLDRFAFDGYVMNAPRSLPRLAEGRNRMELRTGDKFGGRTTPWVVPVDFRAEARLRDHLARIETGLLKPAKRERLQVAPDGDKPARAVFRFEAPPGRRFAWAYAVATVPEGPAAGLAKQALLEWSADGVAWTRGAGITIPNTPLQWDGSVDSETVPSGPAPVLWIRLTSDTGIIALDFAGHIEEPPSPATLRIVHRWREGERERSFEAPAGQAVYDVVCGAAPERHTIEISVPSLRAASRDGSG